LLNLAGEGLPMIFALATIPFVIRGLGSARFGVLALAWAVLGYFGVFDLGIGRAATKFVAEALGRNEAHHVPAIGWSALRAQLLLGTIGGIVLAVLAGPLVTRVLTVPADLTGEALASFYQLSPAIPLVLVSGSLRGMLEAAHRFDLVNAVKVPFSSANSLLPALGVMLGWHLPGIVALLVGARLLAAIIWFLLCVHVFPGMARSAPAQRARLKTLVEFGGWVTVSSIVSPLLVYLDRFMIGSILSMAAVTYYSAPYEMVTRLLVIPGSLAATLFPTFSALTADPQHRGVGPLAARSIKYILITLGPIVVLTMVFAPDIIRLWLGAAMEEHSSGALRILALGVLFNAIAQIPYTLVQATGRPDLTAKFHLVELPIHATLVWLLITRWGIVGAAAAWSIRAAFDTGLLFAASGKVSSLSWDVLRTGRVPEAALLIAALAVTAGVGASLSTSGWSRVVLVCLALAAAGLVAWSRVLDQQDRQRLTGLVRAA
jgi:O-antigen/teichoic acid export membrane protein